LKIIRKISIFIQTNCIQFMFSNTFIPVLMVLLFLGCKPDNRNTNQQTGFQEIVQKDPSQKDDVPVYYRFPSAREMLNYIKNDALVYQTNLINSTENLREYTSTRSKTLNLGVYLADFSYMILFDRTRKAREYFNAIVELTSDLRISIPEEDEIIQRVSDNLHNPDSLISISDDYQSYIIDYLIQTDKEKTLAVLSTGSYIEGLYITLNMIADYEKNKKTLEKIAEQKYAFNNLVGFAKAFPEDVHTKYAIQQLEIINQHFSQLPVVTDETQSERIDSSRMIFKGGNQINISKSQFIELRKEVTEMRAEIVKHNKGEK